MTDNEFEVLDELYFVQSFEYLNTTCGLPVEILIQTLNSLKEKSWIKVLKSKDEEVSEDIEIDKHYDQLFFLATKKGLLAHNST